MGTGAVVAIITVVGTLVVCGIVAWIVIANMKKQAFTGVVINKTEDEREGAQDDTYFVYSLIVKTDDGQQKNVTVGKKIWDSFKVGDKIIKEAGKLNPTKG